MKETTSIRLIRLARSRPAKYLLQKMSAVIGHVPQALRDIVRESGAHGTCDGAEDVFRPEVANGLDNLALRWKETSDPLWQARHPSFRPEPAAEEPVEELIEVAA